jgi:hypothetical protein
MAGNSVNRRRVSLGQSLRDAIDAPAGDASGGFVSIAVGVWYWIVGQPIRDDDKGSDAE